MNRLYFAVHLMMVMAQISAINQRVNYECGCTAFAERNVVKEGFAGLAAGHPCKTHEPDFLATIKAQTNPSG